MEFYFLSVKNSLKCPKAKSATHCLTELFQIYQNKHWIIRQQDNHTVVPSSRRILLKIVSFYSSKPHKYIYSDTVKALSGPLRGKLLC